MDDKNKKETGTTMTDWMTTKTTTKTTVYVSDNGNEHTNSE